MKICPFLVAGDESLQHRGTMSLRTPVETPRLEITRNEADAAPQAEKHLATELWAIDEQQPPRAALECLGEPCRFFHAGGCRFDLLFAPGASSTSAAGTLLVQEGDGDGVPMGAVLQEVWSLQRESLKEMIGGFRRFEGEQSRQQATLTGRLEQLAMRVEEARRESPELAKLIDERLAALQILGSTVQKTHDDLVAARGDITATLAAVEGTCSDMAGSRAEIDRTRTVLEGTRSAVDATRTAVDATRDDIAATRTAIDATRDDIAATRQEITSTRQGLESSRAAVEAVQAAILEAREESRRTLQESVAATRRVLGETAEETRAKLEQLVAQNTSESRLELERSLQRVLEDNQDVRGLRSELQQALQMLTGHVREVATAAASLAASSRLAEDLLVEQRALAEALLEREHRDEARRLNNAGVLAYHEAAYDTSIEKFRKAVQLDPSLAEAWNNLGLSYTEMQADSEALEAFKKALELDPNVGQVYNNLGYLYHRRGEIEEAVEMYQRATQRATDSSAAWSNLGNALHTLARRDEAVSAWKRAIELDPSNDKATSALERLGLGSGL